MFVPIHIEALAGVGPRQRLVVAQDASGAIRGAVRGDLFWGAGPEADDRAGRDWMLVPPSFARRPDGRPGDTPAR